MEHIQTSYTEIGLNHSFTDVDLRLGPVQVETRTNCLPTN